MQIAAWQCLGALPGRGEEAVRLGPVEAGGPARLVEVVGHPPVAGCLVAGDDGAFHDKGEVVTAPGDFAGQRPGAVVHQLVPDDGMRYPVVGDAGKQVMLEYVVMLLPSARHRSAGVFPVTS